MTLKQFVVRAAPVSGSALIVDAQSLNAGRLQAYMEGKNVEVGVDFFRASAPVDEDYAGKIVQAYAKHVGLEDGSYIVRQRLPKSNPQPRKPRATNDANLVMIEPQAKQDTSSDTLEQRVAAFHEEQKQAAEKRKAPEQEPQKDALATAVQSLQDAHTSVHGKKTQQPKQEAKASAEKPHGAVVKRLAEEKTKRKYQRKPASERSAKSRSAYERYIKELNQNASEQLPNFMEPVKAGPSVTAEEIDEATLQFAIKLAKLLKGVM